MKKLIVALFALLTLATLTLSGPAVAQSGCDNADLRAAADLYWAKVEEVKRNHCASTSPPATVEAQLRAAARKLQRTMRAQSCSSLDGLKPPIPHTRPAVCRPSFKRSGTTAPAGPTSRPVRFRTAKSLSIYREARLLAVYQDTSTVYHMVYELMAANLLRRIPQAADRNSQGLDDAAQAKFKAMVDVLNAAFGSSMRFMRQHYRLSFWQEAGQLREAFEAHLRSAYSGTPSDAAAYQKAKADAKKAVDQIAAWGDNLKEKEELRLDLRRQRDAASGPAKDTIRQKIKVNEKLIEKAKLQIEIWSQKARKAIRDLQKATWNLGGKEIKLLAKVVKIVADLPNSEKGKEVAQKYLQKARAAANRPALVVLYCEAAIRSLSPARQRLLTGDVGVSGLTRAKTNKDLRGLVILQGPDGQRLGVANGGKVVDGSGNVVSTDGKNVFVASSSLIARLTGNRGLDNLYVGFGYSPIFNTLNEMRDGVSMQNFSMLFSYQFKSGGWQLPLSLRLGLTYVTGGNPTRTKDPENRFSPVLGVEWKVGYKWSWLTFYFFTAEFDFLPWANGSFGTFAFEFDISKRLKLQVQLFKWNISSDTWVSGGTQFGSPLPNLTANGYSLSLEFRL